ncbi:2OG-Fe(II) oxygenase [Trinickia sp. EG282A]|uniref:2OG-Fe(II) oxygenase n=1 Tax=Trinickia sp. EG282A TaxID=3237013 RepID=UPI0034D2C1C4
MPVLDDTWRDWLTLNQNRGCTPESMIEAMIKAGFDQVAASAAVARSTRLAAAESTEFAAPEVGTEAAIPERTSREYQYDPLPVASGHVIRAEDRNIKVLLRCEKPQIIVFGDVLTDDECQAIIERSRDRLRPSTTVNPETGSQDVIPNRTSDGIWFQRGENELIARLERRFASLMNWPVENGEGLQVLRYQLGGEYCPHFDYFPPNQRGSNVHVKRGGQRVATLIVYLNDVEAGGATIFPEVGISVVPRKGSAVYFRYMNEARQLDPLTLHGGTPVAGGEKWIMTKWVREHPHL